VLELSSCKSQEAYQAQSRKLIAGRTSLSKRNGESDSGNHPLFTLDIKNKYWRDILYFLFFEMN
jgi:hypothetical protein